MVSLSILLAGFCGGLIRGLVGFVKYQFSYKKVPFKLGYFLSMMLISGVIGLTASWVIGNVIDSEVTRDVILVYAFVAGYAGGDFIENAFKIILKKPSLYPLPDIFKVS